MFEKEEMIIALTNVDGAASFFSRTKKGIEFI
jgi:hypothetical protein